MPSLLVLVSVQADSKRAKNFKNRDRDRINRPNFGGRTLARLVNGQKYTGGPPAKIGTVSWTARLFLNVIIKIRLMFINKYSIFKKWKTERRDSSS
ncbi:hypothetical protein BpHYR1_018317 [Brachionus plicatilis]|uniref:Uncharacterized protein n=1 Tax=Brachionus plicatilis TaxID=10195 RepID=A0A3M7QL02_BRAPC|nr:hypothetical protein BpHYR1_018317 [Brachionus plicatilis]